MNRKINALVLDVDGVLTDGTVGINGPSAKRLFLRDIDALTRARENGIQIAFLSGESEAEARPVIERCGGGVAVYDAKDKEEGIQKIVGKLGVTLDEICYIGDARRDVPALRMSGLGLTPADADHLAKSAADQVLTARGGRGAISEAVDMILGIGDKKHGFDSQ